SRLAAGQPAPFAVLAAEQTAGRGRLGRAFASPAGGALALTLAHRTRLAPAARTWFPLVAGLATVDVLTSLPWRRSAGIGLKWPNDIHTTDGRKLGGILVEGHGSDTVLLGIGLNLAGPIRDAGGRTVDHAAWLLGPGGLLGDEDGTAREASHAAAESLREAIGAGLAARLAEELTTVESTGGDGDVSGI